MRHRSAVRAGTGPLDFAGGVGLLFPDGDAGFDEVDEKAIGFEGRFAVGRGGQGHDGAVADREGADTVDGEGLGDGELSHRFGEDALAFFGREDGVTGVMKFLNVATFVVVSDKSLEDDECAASRVSHFIAKGGDINGRVLDSKHGGNL